jgi:hypothetical protein
MAIVVVLQGKHKGLRLRRIEAWAEVDGAWRVMVFITNNLAWSPRSVCDLYRRRWDIEVFFTRLFAVTRAARWERLDLGALLKSYGTASALCSEGKRPPPEKVASAISRKRVEGHERSRSGRHRAQPVG